MLNATQATSVHGALQYYRAALAPGDYYLRSEVDGGWYGDAAMKVGLKPGRPVTEATFKAFLEGSHPGSGKQLTKRLRKDRRPGIDLTFSVPKSASLAWAIGGDEEVRVAMEEAVHETMAKDVEPLVCRRLRSGQHVGTRDRKQTGNLLYASFTHKNSRPVDGQADPHLHMHCFVMNLTADEDEFYAAELEEVMRRLPLLQAAFEARFARRLQQLGYSITSTRYRQSGKLKTGWEIEGLARETLEKFSRRTLQIEEAALMKGIKSPQAKGELGATTREAKQAGKTIDTLRGEWHSRLTPSEFAAFNLLRYRRGNAATESEALRAKAAIRFALEHHLFRNSTVERYQVLATALEQALTLTPEQLKAALDDADVIQASEEVRGLDSDLVTTREVLEAERRMIAYVRDGRGTRLQIGSREYEIKNELLSGEQRRAVLHVLRSKDSVTGITGGAGTGKSTLMQEAASGIKAAGKRLYVFAPSTGAAEVLVEKGFAKANTVEHLIRNTKLHREITGGVLWIDEAGLLDVRSMNAVFDIAKANSARIVLSGDTRQHSSPRRGEAMRLLEKHSGINIARVEEIRRQRGDYKKAIELVSRGHEIVNVNRQVTGMLAGFDMLDRLGKVHEIDAEDRLAELADAYIEAHLRGKSTLVVSPTHAEGQAVTAEIRDRLREAGAIGVEERLFTQLRSCNLTEAEKSQPETYKIANPDDPPMVVQFHQNVTGGFVRGERYYVTHDNSGLPSLSPISSKKPSGSDIKPIPLDHASRFEAYQQSQVAFAKGDKLRLTLGGKTADGRRLANGRLDEVAGFDKQGHLQLKSGLTIDKNYGHFDLGFVVTSHASQGKDVDVAIAAMGSESLPAINSKQFYVTASRGRKDLAIYVEDKAATKRAIQRAGEQLSATELAQRQRTAEQRASIRRRHSFHQAFVERAKRWWQRYGPSHSPRRNKQSHQRPTTLQPHLRRT